MFESYRQIAFSDLRKDLAHIGWQSLEKRDGFFGHIRKFVQLPDRVD